MRKLNGKDSFISLSAVIASWMWMYVTMYSIKHFSQVLLAVFQPDLNRASRQISLQLPALSSSPFSQIRISLLGLLCYNHILFFLKQFIRYPKLLSTYPKILLY